MSIRHSMEDIFIMSLARDYLLRGLFATERPTVRSLMMSRRKWDYKNNEFEYRTQLSTPNASGTLASQVITRDGALVRPGNTNIAVQKATYGTVIGGFSVDMFSQRESESHPRYFDSQVGIDTRNARYDMANTAARVILGGKFMVLFQVSNHILRKDNGNSVVGFTPTVGTPFVIRTPAEVMASGYSQGMLLIKASGKPGGPSNAREAYVIIDIQPNGNLELLPIGQPSVWQENDFIEAFGNRLADGTVKWEAPSMSTYPMGNWTFAGNATRYLDETNDPGVALVGAMEGLPDLFPWFVDSNGQRLGLDAPYRGLPNRLIMSAQKAGNIVIQQPGQSVMDAIESGVAMSRHTVPHEEMIMMVNPAVFPRINSEEGEKIQLVQSVQIGERRHFNQGATTFSAQVGSYIAPAAVVDPSLPSDVVLIGPRNRIEQIGWGNPYAALDEFMDAEFGNTPPQAATAINVPTDVLATLNTDKLFTVSASTHGDASQRGQAHNIKPEVLTHITMFETGALFTEVPHAFTVVKLDRPHFVGG